METIKTALCLRKFVTCAFNTLQQTSPPLGFLSESFVLLVVFLMFPLTLQRHKSNKKITLPILSAP
jgi:hypothetical protein